MYWYQFLHLSTMGLVIWLSLDALILSVAWAAVYIIEPRWPVWWRDDIVDRYPDIPKTT